MNGFRMPLLWPNIENSEKRKQFFGKSAVEYEHVCFLTNLKMLNVNKKKLTI